MFEWIPTKTNTTARKMILLLFLGSAALMVTTMLVPTVPFRWVFQLIAIFLLTAGVFLTTRYITKLFIYRIENGDLTVTEANTNGKRQITVCRVGLANITSVTHCQSAEESVGQIKGHKKNRSRFFDYTVDLQPAEFLLVTVTEGGEELTLRLSYDKTLCELLKPTESKEQSYE